MRRASPAARLSSFNIDRVAQRIKWTHFLVWARWSWAWCTHAQPLLLPHPLWLFPLHVNCAQNHLFKWVQARCLKTKWLLYTPTRRTGLWGKQALLRPQAPSVKTSSYRKSEILHFHLNKLQTKMCSAAVLSLRNQ